MEPLPPLIKRPSVGVAVVPVRLVGRKFSVTIRLPDTVLYIRERTLAHPGKPWSHYKEITHWAHTNGRRLTTREGTLTHTVVTTALSLLRNDATTNKDVK